MLFTKSATIHNVAVYNVDKRKEKTITHDQSKQSQSQSQALPPFGDSLVGLWGALSVLAYSALEDVSLLSGLLGSDLELPLRCRRLAEPQRRRECLLSSRPGIDRHRANRTLSFGLPAQQVFRLLFTHFTSGIFTRSPRCCVLSYKNNFIPDDARVQLTRDLFGTDSILYIHMRLFSSSFFRKPGKIYLCKSRSSQARRRFDESARV